MPERIRQGFHAPTSQILICIEPDDVIEALNHAVSRDRAIELMKRNEDSLIRAYHYGWDGEWMLAIRDVLGDELTDDERRIADL